MTGLKLMTALAVDMLAKADVQGDAGITFEFATERDAYRFRDVLISLPTLDTEMIRGRGDVHLVNAILKCNGIKIGVKTAGGKYIT